METPAHNVLIVVRKHLSHILILTPSKNRESAKRLYDVVYFAANLYKPLLWETKGTG